MATIQERMAAVGFELQQTGGGCTAYVRDDGQVEELVTVDDDASAPTKTTDRVAVGTGFSNDSGSTTYETGYTMGQVLAALEDPRKEYILLGLRLYNGYGK